MFLSQIQVLAPLGSPGSDNVIAIDQCQHLKLEKQVIKKTERLQRVTLACDGLLLKMTMMYLLFIGT